MTEISLLLFSCVLYIIQTDFVSKTQASNNANKEKVILMACGSFNPPTIMHLQLFEIARDHMQCVEKIDVIGGIISPVHETYKKQQIYVESNDHRRNMMNSALLTSDWIRLSDFEMQQPRWTPTDIVLRHHQDTLDSILNGELESNATIPNWLPPNITEYKERRVQIRFLSGADILGDFANYETLCAGIRNCEPWSYREIDTILGNHGLVVVSRDDIEARKTIFVNNSDLLFKHRLNISIAENWIPGKLNSNLIRMHLRRGLSVKYFMNNDVLDYIYKNSLYHSDARKYNEIH